MPDTAIVVRKRVIPRPAASLIVTRHSRAAGLELLMGLRGARHHFMPNILVFPGGRVDREDHRAPIASPLRDDTRALLERKATPGQARAIAVAAARELEEETGLSLAPRPGHAPELDGLEYLCRAVTPPDNRTRFNARFLVTNAERVCGVIAGSGELEALGWYTLEDVLAHKLAGITRGVLENLQLFLTLDVDARATRQETPINQRNRWSME